MCEIKYPHRFKDRNIDETAGAENFCLKKNENGVYLDYNLRGDYILNLPKVNSTKNGLKTWRYNAAKQWNSLPNKIRAMTSRKEFSKHIRAFEFN